MTWKLVSALALGAALLAVAPAEAASCKRDADCPAGQVCSAGTCRRRTAMDESTLGTKGSPYMAWGGLGIYDVGRSVDIPGFGSVSDSKAYFGLHAGGAANVLQLTNDLPLVAWADLALTLGSEVFVPMAAGAGVRYDKAGPLQLLGGIGLALMPGGGTGVTPVGLRILAMALYPFPQVHKNFSWQGQFSYDFLSDGFHMFEFTVGAGWAL
jgi:Cys-rich repeat protein